MDLQLIWFLAIAVLWTGYFVLEGFDFGVGMLLPVVGRHSDNGEADRRVAINSIGPVWDGNEVWLITAVGAMFAAFPAWYAATFSGFYLPVLLVLLALIGRGVAFEYRGKQDSPQWRRRWDAVIVAGSVVPAFVWGALLTAMVRGVPLGADGVVRGGALVLLQPVALLGGLTMVALCLLHGAFFLALKTDGPVRVLARAVARRVAPVSGALLVAYVVVLGSWWGAVAVAALVVGALVAARGREGWAFAATAVAVGALVAVLFSSLWPGLLHSSIDPAYDLTAASAAAGPYTLTVLSWVAVVFLPVVLGYQGWTYWVFRKRVTRAAVGS
jgi:cytochrome bd ubiquinol oxidase subunit II